MTESALDTPAVMWSRNEQDRAGTPLLVLLHGYGADEQDLFGIAAALPSDFTVVSIRASLAAGPGFAWFPLSGDISFSLQRVKDATATIAAWLDSIRSSHSSVTLLGLSQGMCMATSLARHRPADFAAVVGLSGFAVKAEEDNSDGFFADEELARRQMPVFWGRDQADPMIPQAAVEYTGQWLRAHSTLTKVLYANMGHGINAQELSHVKEFLTASVLRG